MSVLFKHHGQNIKRTLFPINACCFYSKHLRHRMAFYVLMCC